MNLTAQILIFVGAFFMFAAALGVFRMPDIYMRLHANTKSATFGVFFLLLGAATAFAWDGDVAIRAAVIIAFLFATAPVAAHMIGRAAYIAGAPLWEGTLSDDLEGKYDPQTHELASPNPPAKTKLRKRASSSG